MRYRDLSPGDVPFTLSILAVLNYPELLLLAMALGQNCFFIKTSGSKSSFTETVPSGPVLACVEKRKLGRNDFSNAQVRETESDQELPPLVSHIFIDLKSGCIKESGGKTVNDGL